MQGLEWEMEQKVSGKMRYKICTTGQVNKKAGDFIYCVITGQWSSLGWNKRIIY